MKLGIVEQAPVMNMTWPPVLFIMVQGKVFQFHMGFRTL